MTTGLITSRANDKFYCSCASVFQVKVLSVTKGYYDKYEMEITKVIKLGESLPSLSVCQALACTLANTGGLRHVVFDVTHFTHLLTYFNSLLLFLNICCSLLLPYIFLCMKEFSPFACTMSNFTAGHIFLFIPSQIWKLK